MKLARGQSCKVRLPNCSGGGEDTVAAHYRSVSLGAGIATKPADFLTAHACFHCHNVIDGREFLHDHSRDKVRLAHAEGVLRTLLWLHQNGVIEL